MKILRLIIHLFHIIFMEGELQKQRLTSLKEHDLLIELDELNYTNISVVEIDMMKLGTEYWAVKSEADVEIDLIRANPRGGELIIRDGRLVVHQGKIVKSGKLIRKYKLNYKKWTVMW